MAGIQKRANNCMKLVAVNERGHVVGESHPRAVLSDHEVDLVFQLREEGLSLGRIAKAMEVSKSCIQHILAGRFRGQIVARWVRVSVRGKN